MTAPPRTATQLATRAAILRQSVELVDQLPSPRPWTLVDRIGVDFSQVPWWVERVPPDGRSGEAEWIDYDLRRLKSREAAIALGWHGRHTAREQRHRELRAEVAKRSCLSPSRSSNHGRAT